MSSARSLDPEGESSYRIAGNPSPDTPFSKLLIFKDTRADDERAKDSMRRFKQSRQRIESHTKGVHVSLSESLFRIADELDQVESVYSDFTSPYEGFESVYREVYKLCESIKGNGQKEEMLGYATSIAVMSVKFMMDLC